LTRDRQTGKDRREVGARMNQQERMEFVRSHRTAIFGYNRKNDGPSMSVVYYVMDGDDILVSTMAERGKAKVVRRNPKISLCVLDEKWPLTYLQVYCDATIETDLEAATDLMMKIAGVMAGNPMPDSVRPMIRQGAIAEQRVVLRLKPYQTFETPPRHVNTPKDVETLTHSLGVSMPWK
jgi:PPOX class probable F420-dependent enzyme